MSLTLHFRSIGQGTPIIILHGLYGLGDNWTSIARAMAHEHQIYLIDQRNHGRSPHHKSHTYSDLSHDLFHFMQQNQIAKAHLVGHSMGGKVVMQFAAEHPQAILSAVIIDISPKAYPLNQAQASQNNHAHILESLIALPISEFKSREMVNQSLATQIPDERIRQFLLKNLDRTTQNQFYWRCNLLALQQNLPHIMAEIPASQASKPFEMLFLRGLNSPYIQTDDLKTIATQYPEAQIIDVPNAGHWIHAEQPEFLLKTLKYFLAR